MTNEKASVIIGNIPVYGDECYSIAEYQDAKTMAIKALEQEPCEDAISRNAVCDYIAEFVNNEYSTQTECDMVDYMIDGIQHLPSVNPQEPKTGHWIAIDEEPHEDYECDKCGYTISTFTANIEPHTEYKYCPNCGAKMESEDME